MTRKVKFNKFLKQAKKEFFYCDSVLLKKTRMLELICVFRANFVLNSVEIFDTKYSGKGNNKIRLRIGKNYLCRGNLFDTTFQMQK